MKKLTNYLLVSTAALLWVSCASNPQTRIEKDPETFESLSPDEQAQVQEGKIAKGMSQEAVRLALGEPDSVNEGSSSNGDYVEWQYYSLSPTYAHSFGFHGGYGGRYGRRFRGGFGLGYGGGFGCGFGGLGYGGGISYVPRLTGVVRFSGGYVDEFKARSSN